MSPRRSRLADLQRERDLFQQENHRLLVEAMALRAVREAATALLAKMDAVHADPRYVSVWTVNQIHMGPYTGPKYDDEMTDLRAALSPLMLGVPISDEERDRISKDGP